MTLVMRPGYGGAAVSDPDAMAYLQAVEVADNQALEQGVQQAVNQFVIGCKADGIWTAIKASCILAGARTLSGALVPLVGTAPTNVGLTSYNRKNGIKGGGSGTHLNTNRNNTAEPQNNRHVSYYTTSVTTAGAYRIMIGHAYTPNGWTLMGEASGLSNNSQLEGFSVDSTRIVYNQSPGFAGITRNNSGLFSLRANGVTSSSNSTSRVPDSANILVNSNTTSDFAFYSIGESLNLALLDARVTTLINAFAAAIP